MAWIFYTGLILFTVCSVAESAPPQKKPKPSDLQNNIHGFLVNKTERLRRPLQKEIWKRLEVERVLDNAVQLLSEKASGSVKDNVGEVADGLMDIIEDVSDKLFDVQEKVDAYKVPDITTTLRVKKENISQALRTAVDALDSLLEREEDEDEGSTVRPHQSSPPIIPSTTKRTTSTTTTTTTRKPSTTTSSTSVEPVVIATKKRKWG